MAGPLKLKLEHYNRMNVELERHGSFPPFYGPGITPFVLQSNPYESIMKVKCGVRRVGFEGQSIARRRMQNATTKIGCINGVLQLRAPIAK